jgi:pilus assembly protein CpaB
MKLLRVLVLAVALAAGGSPLSCAQHDAGNAPGPTVVELAPQIQSQDVLVAAADIGQGQKLTGRERPLAELAGRCAQSRLHPEADSRDAVEKLAGSVVRSQFIAGEPIREAKLARPESGFLSAILPPGKRAVAVRVSAQNTAGGFILPNDRWMLSRPSAPKPVRKGPRRTSAAPSLRT